MQTWAAFVMEWVVVVFIAGLAALILYEIWNGKIDLSGLLSEPASTNAGGAQGAGKASLSRVQLLLFTFIIAGLYLTLCFEAGEMLAIPNQVLGLLGISGGSYVVSKGIQMNKSKSP